MSNENEKRLIAAAKEGKAAIINAYVRGKLGSIDIDCLDAETGNTALIYAAENGHREIVESLLKAGSKINIQSLSGNTALMRAAAKGHDKVVQILIYNENMDNVDAVNLDAVNLDGDTAFILSCANGHYLAAISLIEGGCNYEAQNNTPETGMGLLRSRHPEWIDLVQNEINRIELWHQEELMETDRDRSRLNDVVVDVLRDLFLLRTRLDTRMGTARRLSRGGAPTNRTNNKDLQQQIEKLGDYLQKITLPMYKFRNENTYVRFPGTSGSSGSNV